MTFNLKNINADEIVEAMADTLGFKKEAKTFASLGAYKIVLALANCKAILGRLHYTNVTVLFTDPSDVKKVWQTMNESKRCGGKADDGQSLDDDITIAVSFALKNLVKVADELDANGFEELAAVIDEGIGEISKNLND
jgi:hypothetical protein